jgi:hypothetical protein
MKPVGSPLASSGLLGSGHRCVERDQVVVVHDVQDLTSPRALRCEDGNLIGRQIEQRKPERPDPRSPKNSVCTPPFGSRA